MPVSPVRKWNPAPVISAKPKLHVLQLSFFGFGDVPSAFSLRRLISILFLILQLSTSSITNTLLYRGFVLWVENYLWMSVCCHLTWESVLGFLIVKSHLNVHGFKSLLFGDRDMVQR